MIYSFSTFLVYKSILITEEKPKSLLMKLKEQSEKVGLNLTFRKLRSWHPVPSLQGK